MAPVSAFSAAFEEAGIEVSAHEIRREMGLEKRRHLERMLNDEGIASRWRSVHGSNPARRDVDSLYEAFEKHLAQALPRYADPIHGLLDVVAQLRASGIKIGSNSGYDARMMNILSEAAMAHGFKPDCIVSASDVSNGRPAPDLSLRCLQLLGLDHDCAALKVDDTRAGIEEGRRAGLWTAAVAISGNEIGLSFQQWSALDRREQRHLRDRAYERVGAWGADYAIDTVADLGRVIADITARAKVGKTTEAR